ncbi:MAG: hypothetical protein EOO38_26745 [Cytophagaceae bacterium]|nr:MAG: hypothetical protein EOO38_26745 [Cytophagaceae bacterium]
MKRSKFSEEQVIWVLREAEAGARVDELCRKHGMSSPTLDFSVKNCLAGAAPAGSAGFPPIKTRAGNSQHAAHLSNLVLVTMRVNESKLQDFSSSMNLAAFFKVVRSSTSRAFSRRKRRFFSSRLV